MLLLLSGYSFPKEETPGSCVNASPGEKKQQREQREKQVGKKSKQKV
jgi:hypothetical protein